MNVYSERLRNVDLLPATSKYRSIETSPQSHRTAGSIFYFYLNVTFYISLKTVFHWKVTSLFFSLCLTVSSSWHPVFFASRPQFQGVAGQRFGAGVRESVAAMQ